MIRAWVRSWGGRRNVRVPGFLGAYSGPRPMAGKHDRIVGQGVDLLLNRPGEHVEATARQIPPANAGLKEGVTDESGLGLRLIKKDIPRAMAGHMAHREAPA